MSAVVARVDGFGETPNFCDAVVEDGGRLAIQPARFGVLPFRIERNGEVVHEDGRVGIAWCKPSLADAERLLSKRARLRQVSVRGLRQCQPIQQRCDRDMIRAERALDDAAGLAPDARRAGRISGEEAEIAENLEGGRDIGMTGRMLPPQRDGPFERGPGIGESARPAVHQADELERLRQRERSLDGVRFANGQGFGEVLLSLVEALQANQG